MKWNKKTGRRETARFWFRLDCAVMNGLISHRRYVRGLGSLCFLRDFKRHALAGLERNEAFHVHFGKMDEQILSPVIGRNETVPLVVEKFCNRSGGHVRALSLCVMKDRFANMQPNRGAM